MVETPNVYTFAHRNNNTSALNSLRKITKWFLPVLFIIYTAGITLFTHSHVVNGVIIVHSHPFKGEHQHTELELETVFYLSSFISPVIPAVCAAVAVLLVLLCLLAIPTTERIKCPKLFGHINLRAPPAPLNPASQPIYGFLN